MRNKILIFSTYISIIFLIAACQEDKINESGTITTQDYLFAEHLFNDVGRIVEDAFISNGENKSCPGYTLMNLDTSNIDTIILDFGDGSPDDCLSYGKERRGKVIITYTGKYKDSLSVIRTTFDHYYVNNNWIQGERILTNNGRNQSGNITFSIEVIGASITGDGTINWEANMIQELISGSGNIDPIDDKYMISGHANGSSSNGENFSVTITEDIYADMSCAFSNSCILTSGAAELTPEGYTTRYISYGDSICDCNFWRNLNDEDHFIVIN